jgi:putative transposase
MKSPPNPHYRHRFPAEISYAVWLYYVFSLRLRDVELILAERGVIVSYETVRRWCKKFASSCAEHLRRRRSQPGDVLVQADAPPKRRGAVQTPAEEFAISAAGGRDRQAAELRGSAAPALARRRTPTKAILSNRAENPHRPTDDENGKCNGTPATK